MTGVTREREEGRGRGQQGGEKEGGGWLIGAFPCLVTYAMAFEPQ